MERREFHLFANLFGAIGGARSPKTTEATDVIVTASAQPYVLREKMKAKQMTHGETVTANLSPVRLEAAYGKMALYFCPMESIEVSQTHTPGDGNDIPAEVTIEGLIAPPGCKPGLYLLKNIRLTSNGTMQVKATAKTEWEVYV